jgi:hypothetical protein
MMSQTSPPTTPSSNYRAIFDSTLEAYRKKTKEDLRSHPLLAKFESCHSPDAILAELRQQLLAFDQPGASRNDRLTRWLKPTVNVLCAFSATIGENLGLVSPGEILAG